MTTSGIAFFVLIAGAVLAVLWRYVTVSLHRDEQPEHADAERVDSIRAALQQAELDLAERPRLKVVRRVRAGETRANLVDIWGQL